jgi:hypothetical protein
MTLLRFRGEEYRNVTGTYSHLAELFCSWIIDLRHWIYSSWAAYNLLSACTVCQISGSITT